MLLLVNRHTSTGKASTVFPRIGSGQVGWKFDNKERLFGRFSRPISPLPSINQKCLNFHGMERVVDSILTRSTKSFISMKCNEPADINAAQG